MKQGTTVRDYLITTKPSNLNAGKCLWAFARKDGRDYFIKEFLEPLRPRPDSMGSVASKQRRHALCQQFEDRHEQVFALLRADDLNAGNLVLPVDFFAEDTRYYKVTDRVDHTPGVPADLSVPQRLVLLRTLVDSLLLMHGKGVVHGDLKPENVLLHRPRHSKFHTAKLIDFDDAYPAGRPPPADVVGGNPSYGAPEWHRYQRDEESPAALTQAVDMFALGLLIHVFVYGALPGFDPAHESPASAVAAGSALEWDSGAGAELTNLLTALTSLDPADRPDSAAVAKALDVPDLLASVPARPSRVRINLAGKPPGRERKGDPR